MTNSTQDFMLGDPQVAGSLAVFPVLTTREALEHQAFATAAQHGAFVKELDGGASVNDLLVANPTPLPVLVYEGEEVLGAQQDRTFDTSILIAAGGKVRAPVSCVEAGRWDGSRSDEHFAPSPQTADPELRRAKRVRANAHASMGREARADQGEVWDAVASRAREHGVASASGAMQDIYQERRTDLRDLTGAIEPVCSQVGAIAAVSGRPVALDLVSRVDVFDALLPRLAQGYALDALNAPDADPDSDRADRFLFAALHAPREDLPTPGLGQGFRVDGPHVFGDEMRPLAPAITGSGLTHDGDLIALSVFPADEGPRPAAGANGSARIARPSRRRRRIG